MKKQKGLAKGEAAKLLEKVREMSIASCDKFGLWTKSQQRKVYQETRIAIADKHNSGSVLSDDEVVKISDEMAQKMAEGYWTEIKKSADRKSFRRHRTQFADRKDAEQEAILRALQHAKDTGKVLNPLKAGDRAMNDFRKLDRRGKPTSIDAKGLSIEPTDTTSDSLPQSAMLIRESLNRLSPYLSKIPHATRTFLAAWRLYQSVARKKASPDPLELKAGAADWAEILMADERRVLLITNLLLKQDALCTTKADRKRLKDRRRQRMQTRREQPQVKALLQYLKSFFS